MRRESAEKSDREDRNTFDERSSEVSVSAETRKLLDRLQDYLAIDKNNLDDCLEEQPQLYYDVSEALALSISRRDASKQNLQVVEARVDREIRRDAANAGDKVTEKEVDALKREDKDVIKANDELLRLGYEVALLGALKEAYGQRSYMLRELAGLYTANYYSNASAGRADRDVRDKHGADARVSMAEERRRKGM